MTVCLVWCMFEEFESQSIGLLDVTALLLCANVYVENFFRSVEVLQTNPRHGMLIITLNVFVCPLFMSLSWSLSMATIGN